MFSFFLLLAPYICSRRCQWMCFKSCHLKARALDIDCGYRLCSTLQMMFNRLPDQTPAPSICCPLLFRQYFTLPSDQNHSNSSAELRLDLLQVTLYNTCVMDNMYGYNMYSNIIQVHFLRISDRTIKQMFTKFQKYLIKRIIEMYNIRQV